MATAGGAIVEVVEQGANVGPSTNTDLDNWIATYELEISTVRPRDGVTTKQLEGRHHTYVVDLSNNVIVFEGTGTGGLRSSLDEIHALLGAESE